MVATHGIVQKGKERSACIEEQIEQELEKRGNLLSTPLCSQPDLF